MRQEGGAGRKRRRGDGCVTETGVLWCPLGLTLHIEADFDFCIFFLSSKRFRNPSEYSHIGTLTAMGDLGLGLGVASGISESN